MGSGREKGKGKREERKVKREKGKEVDEAESNQWEMERRGLGE